MGAILNENLKRSDLEGEVGYGGRSRDQCRRKHCAQVVGTHFVYVSVLGYSEKQIEVKLDIPIAIMNMDEFDTLDYTTTLLINK